MARTTVYRRQAETTTERRRPKLISITGHSGGGKTSVADKTAHRLRHHGRRVLVVNQDSFYRAIDPKVVHELGGKHNFDFDRPERLRFARLRTFLEIVGEGRVGSLPKYSFVKSRPDGRRRVRPPQDGYDVIIVEGHLLHTTPNELPVDLFDLRLFVHPGNDWIKRRLLRDVSRTGEAEATIQDRINRFVVPATRNWIEPQAAHAHVVIVNDDEATMQIASGTFNPLSQAWEQSAIHLAAAREKPHHEKLPAYVAAVLADLLAAERRGEISHDDLVRLLTASVPTNMLVVVGATTMALPQEEGRV